MKLMQDREQEKPDAKSMLIGFIVGFLLGMNLAIQCGFVK